MFKSRTAPQRPPQNQPRKPLTKPSSASRARRPAPAAPLQTSLALSLTRPQTIWLVVLGSLVAEVVTVVSLLPLCRGSNCLSRLLEFLTRTCIALNLTPPVLCAILALSSCLALLPLGSSRWKALVFRGFISYQRKVLEHPRVMVILPAMVIGIAALEIMSHGSKVGPRAVFIALILSGVTFYKIFSEYRELLQKRMRAILTRKELVGSFLRFRWRLHLCSLVSARIITLVGWLLIGAILGDAVTGQTLESSSLAADLAQCQPGGGHLETCQLGEIWWWPLALWGISAILIGLLRPPRRIAGFLNESFCPRCNRFLFLPISGSETYCPSCKIGEFPGVFGVGGRRSRHRSNKEAARRRRQQREQRRALAVQEAQAANQRNSRKNSPGTKKRVGVLASE